MKISIHQPQYIPWMPYFAKIKEADLFVLLDHVEFQKNGLQNRNQIKSSSGANWLTVPVVQSLGQKINAVETVGHMNWQAKHWNTIRHSYSKSKYFKTYADEIEEVYQLKWNNLCELNCHLLKKLCKWLEIDTPMVLSSEYNLSSSGTDLVHEICSLNGATSYISGIGGKNYLDESKFVESGIELIYRPPIILNEYPQPFPKVGFVGSLSAIDVIFNCGNTWKDYI
jgi:hypothetical protein